ncbi:PREDICTED: NAC domain-containing protein 3-like [Camelina sativa]|uniref:NAC domain-containing protein 3-like n=1 Tax=Camelina sativa TaxID=90675 RepID=A0ABM0VJI7_CAMSA|nr:PREDICTED: NAC domain-containing protein 3-like [Camelina sativa]
MSSFMIAAGEMETPVGLRFCPTDEEIVDDYLRPKNLETDTSRVDQVISTVTICSFDPWELPCQSRIKLKDKSWCFFSRKVNKYDRGEQQIRKTKSGYWKITGKPKSIIRNRVKIGARRVLMFYLSKELGGSKSDWVMHEYHLLSPVQMMMTYTICKVTFKGEENEVSSPSAGSEIEQSRSLIPLHLVNNSGGSEDSSQFGLQEEAHQLDDAAIIASKEEEWKTWLNDNDGEERNIMFLQDNRNDYRPPQSLTGVFTDDSSDDNDSDFLSPATNSIGTSSTCDDSFGSSNHRIDQIKDLQEPPNSTVELVSPLTQEVSQALRTNVDTNEMKKKMNPCDDARGTEIGEHKLGQEMIKKNKRTGNFFLRMVQKFVKKIRLCSPISRT